MEAQVAASSKSEVAGNVLIWFLCAVAFLKVSQKIDSFMATLGVNVGRTGGSLLAEAMLTMRAVTMVAGGKGGAGTNRAGAASSGKAGTTSGSGMSGFFKGGLIGMASRHVTNSAIKTATSQTSAVHTAQSSVRQATAAVTPEAPSGVGPSVNNDIHTGGVNLQTEGSATAGSSPQEGVIVTDATPPPVAAQSDGQVSAADQASGTVLNIPLADSSIPDSSIPDGSIPAEAAPIVSPGESVSTAESISISDSGAAFSVPQSGGTMLNIPPADGSIPYGSTLDGSVPTEAAPIVSPNESVSVAENISVSDGGIALNVPQGEGAALIGAGNGPVQEGVIVTASDQQTNTQSSTDTQNVQKSSVVERSHTVRNHTKPVQTGIPSLGGAIFSKSLVAGGSFANDVIGTVARGEVAGRITGDMAAQSLQSYLGYTAEGKIPPIFSNTEIGGGRISGYVSTPEHPQPIAFGMYHAEQYMEPTGTFSKVRSADGTLWYTQMPQDVVERKPYMASDDKVAYQERIIKKLPDPPKRKDRV